MTLGTKSGPPGGTIYHANAAAALPADRREGRGAHPGDERPGVPADRWPGLPAARPRHRSGTPAARPTCERNRPPALIILFPRSHLSTVDVLSSVKMNLPPGTEMRTPDLRGGGRARERETLQEAGCWGPPPPAPVPSEQSLRELTKQIASWGASPVQRGRKREVTQTVTHPSTYIECIPLLPSAPLRLLPPWAPCPGTTSVGSRPRLAVGLAAGGACRRPERERVASLPPSLSPQVALAGSVPLVRPRLL